MIAHHGKRKKRKKSGRKTAKSWKEDKEKINHECYDQSEVNLRTAISVNWDSLAEVVRQKVSLNRIEEHGYPGRLCGS